VDFRFVDLYVCGRATGVWTQVSPGTLAFSVTIFTVEAIICIAVLLLRRRAACGGELGGPMKYKLPTTLLFVTLWLVYVGLGVLEAYCVIEGF
jgi:solute carrier family 8 (sodium/calcium exchanger)